MKTKNVILGLAALVFAIGSAFTSVTPVAPDYISVDFDNGTIGDFTCIQLPENFACNGNQPAACKVNVTLKDGSVAQAQVYELKTDVVNCTTALFDSRPIIGSYPTGGTAILAVH